jgi:ABC-type cobalt transport system substrate-binding protein
MKEQTKKFLQWSLIVLIILFITLLFSQKQSFQETTSKKEETFKEITKAYERLMGPNLNEERTRIEHYLQSSKDFKNFPKDRKLEEAYYDFGKIFKVENISVDDLSNPHLVAKNHLYKCLNGNTDDILKIIPVVETDDDLAKSFMYYIDSFCKIPSDCPLINKNIYIKFAGIYHKKDVSVWYYYLVDSNGQPLLNNSWISLHCSNQNGICALTGVFFNSEKCSPKGVIKTEKDYSILPYDQLDTK